MKKKYVYRNGPVTDDGKNDMVFEAFDNINTEQEEELKQQIIRMKQIDGTVRYRYSNNIITFETDEETMLNLIRPNSCEAIKITEVK